MATGGIGQRPTSGRRRLSSALAFLLTSLASVAAFAADAPTVAQVKATFIVRFVQFVEWPATAFKSADDAIVIAVLGDDPLVADVEKTIATERVNGRALQLRHATSPEDARRAHVVLVGRSEAERVPAIVAALRGAAVLSVSDVESFARQGGMIAFFVENDRIRFDINQKEAEHAGLVVNSRLLNLARVVTTEGER